MILVAIADDHELFRDGLRQIIAVQSDMQVAWEAQDGIETIAFLKKSNCDVLVVDLSMPQLSGIDLIVRARQMHPALPIIVLSMYDEKLYVLESMRAGASGYVTKTSPSVELLDGIRHVARGDFFLSASVAYCIKEILNNSSALPPHTSLTARESQIFRLLLAGKRVNEIAQVLKLSEKTVSTYKTRMQEKLQTPSMAALIKYALQHGLMLDMISASNDSS